MTADARGGGEVRAGNLTIRFTGTRAAVVERRRKVGYQTLACAYICGLLDSDADGQCWSANHGGPRCPVVEEPTS